MVKLVPSANGSSEFSSLTQHTVKAVFVFDRSTYIRSYSISRALEVSEIFMF